jgi:hypothetical protein
VRKSKKARLTAVSAHTGRTDSAKWKAIDGIMRNAVIDGDTTGCRSVENKAFFGEVIDCNNYCYKPERIWFA